MPISIRLLDAIWSDAQDILMPDECYFARRFFAYFNAEHKDGLFFNNIFQGDWSYPQKRDAIKEIPIRL